MLYKVKLLTQMLEERYTLSKVQHIKLSSDRTRLIKDRSYDRHLCIYISFGTLDVCYDGVAESCVYSSALILYYSIDLCTNATSIEKMCSRTNLS